MYASNPEIPNSVTLDTTTDVSSPVRLYLIVYEVMTPLGFIGGDQVNMTSDDSIRAGVKRTGGPPGTVVEINGYSHVKIGCMADVLVCGLT